MKMTETEKQIEGIVRIISAYVTAKERPVRLVGVDCDEELLEYTHNVGIAEALYNAGYRKTFTSALATAEQKAYKEGYQKGFADGQKSTVKDLVQFARDAEAQGYDGIGDLDIIEYADELYGEGVEE